jgi:glycosyltransferase involved in cell wall biosynthesis
MSIVKQLKDNDQVEIIVSDNASTDDTASVVKKYQGMYSNIIYVRNAENIGGDKNIVQSLALGNGAYLKLLNDYLEIKEGGVDLMLSLINKHLSDKTILFFASGNSPIKNVQSTYCNSFEAFLNIASFYTTGIGAIGLWKEHLDTINSYYQFVTKQFYQTELLFECFQLTQSSFICMDRVFDVNEIPNQRISYNFFDTFLNDYLNNLLLHLKTTGKLSAKAFYREKKHLFTGFVYPRYKRFKFKSHHFSIDTSGMEKTIFKVYKTSPFFYGYLLYMPFYLLVFYIKKLFKGKK